MNHEEGAGNLFCSSDLGASQLPVLCITHWTPSRAPSPPRHTLVPNQTQGQAQHVPAGHTAADLDSLLQTPPEMEMDPALPRGSCLCPSASAPSRPGLPTSESDDSPSVPRGGRPLLPTPPHPTPSTHPVVVQRVLVSRCHVIQVAEHRPIWAGRKQRKAAVPWLKQFTRSI